MLRAYWKPSVLLALGGLLIFLAFNRHSHSERFTYSSEIWGDKAGYYIYLPATFIYHWDGENIPESLSERTGNGFQVTSEGIIETKYTSGLAWLQVPFFALATTWEYFTEDQVTGFSNTHFGVFNLIGPFYLICSLVLLWRLFRPHIRPPALAFTLGVFLVCTNWYWYTVAESGMSHVFSLFVFSAIGFLVGARDWKSAPPSRLFLLQVLIVLALLIRPTHIVALAFWIPLASRLNTRHALSWNVIRTAGFWVRGVLVLAVLIAPQILYWKYAFGQWLPYSYGEEGFEWFDPNLLSFWVAPLNGLFLYAPVLLIALFGMTRLIRQRHAAGWLSLGAFLVSSYVLSCWWDWAFGCSYGSRNFVEYSVFFLLPFAHVAKSAWRVRWQQVGLIGLCLLCGVYNLKLIYSYGGCFPGTHPWDWQGYLEWVVRPTL